MLVRTLALISILAAAAPAAAQPDDAALTAIFGDITNMNAPGCAASVTRDGVLVFERAWGSANLEQLAPNRPDTIFEAGSVSKQFTAAAIAVLVARGRIALDDDIRVNLPEMRDYGVPITVRMLLTHTSGIRNWDDLVELAGRPREDASGLTQADAFAIIARQRALNFRPGSEYLYSNSNYVLAAIIVERVSGQSFSAFTHDAIFAPLGMNHTSWRDDYTRVVPGRAEAYTPNDSGELHIDMPAEDVVGPGGLLTTVGDLQLWNAFLDHPSREARAWVRLLTNTAGALSDGTAIAYGLGLEREDIAGAAALSHAGATAGYRAYLARAQETHISVALLCNAGALNTEDMGPALAALFLPAAHATEPTPPTAVGEVPADVAGRYRNTRTGALVTVTSDATSIHFNGGPAFIVLGPDRFANAAQTRSARVQRTAAGAITSLTLTRIGNAAVELQPVSAWSPSTSDLGAFVGAYYSEDVQALWQIALDGETLRATGPRGETFLLDPLYANAFAGRDASWTVVFETNTTGAPVGFSMFKTRTRAVHFERPG